MFHWRGITRRFTRSADHQPHFTDPPIQFEPQGCWNCAGDGDVAHSNEDGGESRTECYICSGTGDLDTSLTRFNYGTWMEALRLQGRLMKLDAEWNLLPPPPV